MYKPQAEPRNHPVMARGRTKKGLEEKIAHLEQEVAILEDRIEICKAEVKQLEGQG